MEMAEVRLGTKCNHHAFVEQVEHMAYVSCQAVTTLELNQLIPSTGVPSDIALTWDGVGIGGTMFSRAETCAIVGVSLMTPSGRIVQRLIASPSENLRKAGECQKDLMLRALARHPARLTIPALRKRLRLVAGDGAVCKGGVDAAHPSTGSGEGLWADVFGSGSTAPPPCTEWDLFHRLDAAVSHVMKAHKACVEYTDVARQCGAFFGSGDGRTLYRCVGIAVTGGSSAYQNQGGTRMIVAITRSIDYVTENLRRLTGGMRARLGLARASRTAQAQHHLIDVGRRLTATNFVMFAVGLSDILTDTVVPLALVAQKDAVGALEVWRSVARTMTKVKKINDNLAEIKDWWSVSSLVHVMVKFVDLRNLWTALLISPLGRRFPRLVGATYECLFLGYFDRCPSWWITSLTKWTFDRRVTCGRCIRGANARRCRRSLVAFGPAGGPG